MKNVKLILIFLAFLIIFTSQTNGGENEYILGINFGYSFGLGGSNSYYDNHKLGYRLGLNLQYYFSSHWAIQGEIAYQRHTYHKWGQDYDGSFFDYTEDESYVVPYLNLIYDFKGKKVFPYFTFGVGAEEITPSFILFLKTGVGMKYSLSPQIGLNLGGSLYLHSFIAEINYLSLNLGLEYRF
ncbi:MAG: outer membrane beta-barrel protein [Candidatus Aminicenantia bacterium]